MLMHGDIFACVWGTSAAIGAPLALVDQSVLLVYGGIFACVKRHSLLLIVYMEAFLLVYQEMFLPVYGIIFAWVYGRILLQ